MPCGRALVQLFEGEEGEMFLLRRRMWKRETEHSQDEKGGLE